MTKLSAKERWRDVPGYEGYYQVSDQGKVRSLDRQVTSKPRRDGTVSFRMQYGKLLKLTKRDGYFYIDLRRERKIANFAVARLVLSAFKRQPRDGEVAMHKDDTPTNNVLTNLRWGTVQDNTDDRVTKGRGAVGIKNGGGGKLSERDVRKIAKRLKQDYTKVAIAEEFNVSDTLIRMISTGRIWSHVTGFGTSSFGG